MLITILEARVSQDRWPVLSERYRKGIKTLPTSLIQTFLIQDQRDSSVWRIISEWKTRQAFKGTKETKDHEDACMEIFRDAGVEPTRRVFEVHGHHENV